MIRERGDSQANETAAGAGRSVRRSRPKAVHRFRRQGRGVVRHGVEGFVELLRDACAFDLSRLGTGLLARLTRPVSQRGAETATLAAVTAIVQHPPFGEASPAVWDLVGRRP